MRDHLYLIVGGLVALTFLLFAWSLCLIIKRSDERMELLNELRDEEIRRSWNGE